MTDYIQIKKRARKATKNRSLKPDAEYIFAATLLSLTVVGLPIAYAVMKEYHKYLKTCMMEYNSNGTAAKGKVFERKRVRSLVFDYNMASFLGALRTIWMVISTKATYYEFDNLTVMQNREAKYEFSQMKACFPEVFAAEALAVMIPVIAILSGNSIALIITPFALLLLALIMIKPFACYLQAHVMLEKIFRQTERDVDGEDLHLQHGKDCDCEECRHNHHH